MNFSCVFFRRSHHLFLYIRFSENIIFVACDFLTKRGYNSFFNELCPRYSNDSLNGLSTLNYLVLTNPNWTPY